MCVLGGLGSQDSTPDLTSKLLSLQPPSAQTVMLVDPPGVHLTLPAAMSVQLSSWPVSGVELNCYLNNDYKKKHTNQPPLKQGVILESRFVTF